MKENNKKKNGAYVIPVVPDEKALSAEVRPLAILAGNYKVTTEDHFNAAWAVVERIDKAIAWVHETFDPFVAQAYALHKMATAKRSELLRPLEDGKAHLCAGRQFYRVEQEAVKRRQAEKAALILQQQQKKELEREAKKMEKQGETETATLFRETAAAVPLPQIAPAPAVPPTEGSVVRTRWVYDYVNPDEVQREYCSPDDKLIRPVVAALGPKCGILGIRVRSETKEFSR